MVLAVPLAVIGGRGCTPGVDARPVAPAASDSSHRDPSGQRAEERPAGLEALPASVETTAGPGDPNRGRDYLLNGEYMGCGIPKRLFDMGPKAEPHEKIAGRTGQNAELPYGFTVLENQGIPTVTSNCIRCHYGVLRGEVVPGLGNTLVDHTVNELALLSKAKPFLQNEAETAAVDLYLERYGPAAERGQTRTLGVVPAYFSMSVMFAHRDPETWAWSKEPLLEYPEVVAPSDIPPWWRIRKRDNMYATGAGTGNHIRFMMLASIACIDDTAKLEEVSRHFPDIFAYLYTLEPPKFPDVVDEALVTEGESVFEDNCSVCHGTYGENETYPNEVVDIDDVGTDPMMLTAGFSGEKRFREWFATSPLSTDASLEEPQGYVAPPLDGIWATGPFLHNGSVPTLRALLDSESRPTQWRRSTDPSDYDLDQVGLRYDAVDGGHDAVPQIYDTTRPGYSNAGHTYGDGLSDRERRAVIEYLKTL